MPITSRRRKKLSVEQKPNQTEPNPKEAVALQALKEAVLQFPIRGPMHMCNSMPPNVTYLQVEAHDCPYCNPKLYAAMTADRTLPASDTLVADYQAGKLSIEALREAKGLPPVVQPQTTRKPWVVRWLAALLVGFVFQPIYALLWPFASIPKWLEACEEWCFDIAYHE